MTNAFDQYKQQSISTMSSGELVITLFDEIAKNLNRASIMFKQEKYDAANICTTKAKKLIAYLISSLDFNIPISNDFFRLYNFFNQEIIRSEIKNSSEPIDEIIPLVVDLKSTWVEAQKIVHKAQATVAK